MTPEPVTWRPGRREVRRMQVWGTGVFAIGVLGFGALYVSSHFFGFAIEPGRLLVGIIVMLAVGVVTVLAHEAVHALTMLPFGARPSFGFGVMAGLVPYLYCTARGHRFTRAQFACVALAPTVLVNLALLLAVGTTPLGGWFVVPAAVHLSGCVGDWYMVRMTLRQPPGTLVEDLPDGMVFHRRG